jgi:NADPH:quinone reductase-like Zn-dependent oxidoreductase
MTKSVVYSEYGGPEVLRLVDVEEPQPGPGQVRIAVRAAGVNQIDGKFRSGAMSAMRPVQFPSTPGLEVSGVVDAVGEGVTAWKPGDEVFAQVSGGYTTQVVTAAATVGAKPEGMSWEEAAALPVGVDTVMRVLSELDVKGGETLLIHGAAGGMGTIAVQFAVADGVTVIGTASESNQDYLRSLGAIPIVYGDGLLDRVRAVAPSGVDAVFDCAGAGDIPDSVKLAGGPSRVVTIADPGGAQANGARFSSGFFGRSYFAEGTQKAIHLFSEGKLQMPIWRSLPFSEAAQAHRLSAEGHLRGKIVLTAE